MTDVDELTGRELDAAVAREVNGQQVARLCEHGDDEDYWVVEVAETRCSEPDVPALPIECMHLVPRYHDDDNACMAVVRAMIADGWHFILESAPCGVTTATFLRPVGSKDVAKSTHGFDDRATILHAALKAKGVGDG